MMNQPLNKYVLEDLLTTIMGYHEITDKTIQATVLSGKEFLISYSALTKSISSVEIRKFTSFSDYRLPFGIRLPVFNDKVNRQIIFQYSKALIFNDVTEELLINIEDYLPYLEKNKRLEKIELTGYCCMFYTIRKIMRSITTELKEIRGFLDEFRTLSRIGVEAKKMHLNLDEFTDFENFFKLPNITPEVVEVSMNPFYDVCFTQNSVISENLSKIKKLILSDVAHFEFDPSPLYFRMLEEIESQNFTSLEEVEVSSLDGVITVANNEDIIKIINSTIQHSEEFKPEFDVTLRTRCRLNLESESWNFENFYKEFKGFKLTKSENGYQEFSKTVRISPKITNIFIISGSNIVEL